jgi:hypothetical protein
MQQFLKSASTATGAGILAAQFLDEILPAVNYAVAAFDTCLGGETPSAFTGDLESSWLRGSLSCAAWDTSFDDPGIPGARIVPTDTVIYQPAHQVTQNAPASSTSPGASRQK